MLLYLEKILGFLEILGKFGKLILRKKEISWHGNYIQ